MEMCAVVTKCEKKLTYSHSLVGTALTIEWVCSDTHRNGRWQSQPRYDGIFATNLQLSMSTLLSGNSFRKIELLFRFVNIACISETTFLRVQKIYAAPAIQAYWNTLRKDLLESYDGSVILCGDGRNDSPGHSAQYLSYNFGDSASKTILHTEVVDVREVGGKSPNMERLGFERSIDQLKTIIRIEEVVTDAHIQIAALMRK
ncbi:uncharacterized protein LOC144363918 [Saccoglossus kowalevskii]